MGRRKRPSRRDGFYWDTFTEAEQALLAAYGLGPETAPSLDDEVQLLRVMIRRLLAGHGEDDPADAEVVGRLVERLGRLQRTRHALGAHGETDPLGTLMARLGAHALADGRATAQAGATVATSQEAHGE